MLMPFVNAPSALLASGVANYIGLCEARCARGESESGGGLPATRSALKRFSFVGMKHLWPQCSGTGQVLRERLTSK
jgi:hypothetical protein